MHHILGHIAARSSAATLAPKFARLDRLKAAGLPVPPGVVVPLVRDGARCAIELENENERSDLRAELEALLATGPVIVRGALDSEDLHEQAAAGLSRSVPGCRDLASIRAALDEIIQGADDPWITTYRRVNDQGAGVTLQALIQRELPRTRLAVLAWPTAEDERHDAAFVELYDDAEDPLAGLHAPRYSGPLARLPAQTTASELAELSRRCAAALAREAPADSASAGALELEFVLTADRVWLVQARPLTRPLVDPGARRFIEACRDDADARAAADAGVALLELDAEHNPAPLSPAHTWLIRWQRAQRPDHARGYVLAGWLFFAGALTRRGAQRSGSARLDDELARGVELLQRSQIPAARARLEELSRALELAPRAALPELFDQSLQRFLEIIDAYHAGAGLRRRARQFLSKSTIAPPRAEASPPREPACLADRASFLDVLPASWDIASPSLAEIVDTPPSPRSAAQSPARATRDPVRDATLLCELDDHLFALGLAPLRRVYLRAAEELQLSREDVFLLDGDTIRAALASDAEEPAEEPAEELAPSLRPIIQRARDELAAHAALTPPGRLLDGRPLPPRAPTQRLRGIPFGRSRRGPLAVRRDLADLISRPASAEAIVALPALTAQAAVVLHSLGVQAVCCEHGGLLSHAAVMARELGLSALIGCRGCTSLSEGTPVWLDARAGRLRALTAATAAERSYAGIGLSE